MIRLWRHEVEEDVDVCIDRIFAAVRGHEGKPGIVLKGCGWGHGVGMCQTGAVGMAKSGKDYKAILSHYFPNCTLEKLY